MGNTQFVESTCFAGIHCLEETFAKEGSLNLLWAAQKPASRKQPTWDIKDLGLSSWSTFLDLKLDFGSSPA